MSAGSSRFRSFEDARTFARSLGLTTTEEWREYRRSSARPKDIPGSPESLYKDQGWAGIKDWLGIPSRFQLFEDARSYVWTLGIKTSREWHQFRRSGKRPSDIPAFPDRVYKYLGWDSWGDWLGTGSLSRRRGKSQAWCSYEDGKAFVHRLGIKTTREWREYWRYENLPKEIPLTPNSVYKDQGWAGYGDWLGTGTIAHQNRDWAPFQEARTFVRSLNLKMGWRKYCKSGDRPVNIPTDPGRIYKDKGWAGYGDWLGTGTSVALARC